MIYEVYHPRGVKNSNKKVNLLVFFKKCKFVTTLSQTVIWNTVNFFPKFIIVPRNLKKQLVRHIQLILR